MSFAKDVVTDVNVPSVQAPDFSQNTSTTQDVVGLLGFGLQIKNRQDALKAKEAQAKKNNELEGLAQGITDFEMAGPGRDMNVQQKIRERQKVFSRLSPIDAGIVRDRAAELSGKSLQKARDAEIDLEKAKQEANDADAMKYAGVPYDENDPNVVGIVNRGRVADAEERSRARKHLIEMDELNKKGKTRENNDEVAKLAADNIISPLSTNIRNLLDREVSALSSRLNLEEGQEGKLTPEQYKEEVVLLVSRGEIQLMQQLPILLEGKSALEQKHITEKFTTLKDNYKLLADELQGAAVGSRYAEFKLNELTRRKQAIDRSILSNPKTAMTAGLVRAGLASADTLKATNDSSMIDLIGGVSEELNGLVENEANTFPIDNPRDSFLSRLHSKSPEAFATGSAALDKSAEMIANEEAGDPDGQKLEIILSDVDKTMDIIDTAPQKGHFAPASVNLITNQVLDRWESMTPAQQQRLGDKMPAYAGNYFGDDSSGAFVPAITKSYSQIVTGGDREFGNLYQLGVNPNTGGIKVVIADDSEIMKHVARNDSASNLGQFAMHTLKPQAERMRKLKIQLNLWARKVENMEAPRRVLNATSKATGIPKEAITSQLLRNMAASSSVSVHEAFIPQVQETEATEGALGTGENRKQREEAPAKGVIGELDNDILAIMREQPTLTFDEARRLAESQQ